MVSAGWHEGGTNRAARDATASRYASVLANTSTAWRVAYRLMWVYIFTLAFFSDAVGAVGITFDALIRDADVSKVRVLLSDVLFDRKALINSVSAIVCAVHELAKVAIWAIISASIGRRGNRKWRGLRAGLLRRLPTANLAKRSPTRSEDDGKAHSGCAHSVVNARGCAYWSGFRPPLRAPAQIVPGVWPFL